MPLAPLDRTKPRDLAWRALDIGLMLGAASDASLVIGASVLAVTAEDRAERDRILLEEVAEDCLVDLRTKLAQAAGVPLGAEWRLVTQPGSLTAMIGGPGGPLALALTDALFSSLTRRTLPLIVAAPLGSGENALDAITVSVSAAIGRAALNVADLKALAIGDVVVLDALITETVPVALNGHALARGRFRVVAADPQTLLEIVDVAA